MDVKSEFISKKDGRITTIFESLYVLNKFSPNKVHKNEWVIEYDVYSGLIELGTLILDNTIHYRGEHEYEKTIQNLYQ